MKAFTRFDSDTLSNDFGFFDGDRCRVVVYAHIGLLGDGATPREAAIALLKQALGTLEAAEDVPTIREYEVVPA